MRVLVSASLVRAHQGRVISTCVYTCCQIPASHGKGPRYAHAWKFPWPRPYSEAKCRCQPLMAAGCCCGFQREPRTAGHSDYVGKECLFRDSQTNVAIFTLK